jgi:ankyrin repeat protein
VRLLVAAGADVNAGLQGDGRTALTSAAECPCCAAVLDSLLQVGADPAVTSTKQRITPLHVAVREGPIESCELLLAAARTLIDIRDVKGRTALMHAAQYGRADIVQLLLQQGAAVNAT